MVSHQSTHVLGIFWPPGGVLIYENASKSWKSSTLGIRFIENVDLAASKNFYC